MLVIKKICLNQVPSKKNHQLEFVYCENLWLKSNTLCNIRYICILIKLGNKFKQKYVSDLELRVMQTRQLISV